MAGSGATKGDDVPTSSQFDIQLDTRGFVDGVLRAFDAVDEAHAQIMWENMAPSHRHLLQKVVERRPFGWSVPDDLSTITLPPTVFACAWPGAAT